MSSNNPTNLVITSPKLKPVTTCRPPAPSGSLDLKDLWLAVALALTAVIIILPGLGAQSLANWDEAIYGVVTRELLARPGMTLYYGGNFWFEKPPLLFWLMAGASFVFGDRK